MESIEPNLELSNRPQTEFGRLTIIPNELEQNSSDLWISDGLSPEVIDSDRAFSLPVPIPV